MGARLWRLRGSNVKVHPVMYRSSKIVSVNGFYMRCNIHKVTQNGVWCDGGTGGSSGGARLTIGRWRDGPLRAVVDDN